MQLVVDPSDELPLYRQIMRQVVDAIAGGRLAAGEKLPSHRDLSEQLVIAPLTVKKAYDELEALGFIETERGRGTFVCAHPPHADPGARMEQLEQAARNLLAHAYLAGLGLRDVERAIRKADRELAQGAPPPQRKDER